MNVQQKNSNRLDITDQRFGKLVAIKPTRKYTNKGSTYYWLFKCDCGNEKEILISNVTRKTQPTRSCGCARRVATSHLGSTERVSFLRNGLRKLWLKWPPRYHTIAAAKVERGKYMCAGYETDAHIVARKEIHVDHIVPLGEWETWDDMIAHLFCSSDKLQILCKNCHSRKSANETTSRADERKERSKK